MLCRPAPFCRIQRKVQGIGTHNTDGSHRHLDGPAPVMSIAEYQIGADLLSENDILMRKLCQHPDSPPGLQAACRLIAYPFSQKGVGKRKRILILDHPVAVADHPKKPVVRIPDIRPVTLNGLPVSCINLSLYHFPVQSRQYQRFSGIRRLRHNRSQPVPRFLSCTEHGFYICCHTVLLSIFFRHTSAFISVAYRLYRLILFSASAFCSSFISPFFHFSRSCFKISHISSFEYPSEKYIRISSPSF